MTESWRLSQIQTFQAVAVKWPKCMDMIFRGLPKQHKSVIAISQSDHHLHYVHLNGLHPITSYDCMSNMSPRNLIDSW